jgi:hypothetical protein
MLPKASSTTSGVSAVNGCICIYRIVRQQRSNLLFKQPGSHEGKCPDAAMPVHESRLLVRHSSIARTKHTNEAWINPSIHPGAILYPVDRYTKWEDAQKHAFSWNYSLLYHSKVVVLFK